MPSAKPSTLYYDGQCPLCSFEMRHLNRLKTEDLVLQDIHAQLNLADASREQYLKVLHLKRSDGSTLTGLDASVYAWQHTPLGPMMAWLRWPIVKTVADTVYGVWARRRFDRRYS